MCGYALPCPKLEIITIKSFEPFYLVFISYFPEKSIEAQPGQFVEKMPRPFKKRGGAAGLGAETGRKKTGDAAADAVQNSPRVTRSANSKGGGGAEGNPRYLQRPTPISTG